MASARRPSLSSWLARWHCLACSPGIFATRSRSFSYPLLALRSYSVLKGHSGSYPRDPYLAHDQLGWMAHQKITLATSDAHDLFAL